MVDPRIERVAFPIYCVVFFGSILSIAGFMAFKAFAFVLRSLASIH